MKNQELTKRIAQEIKRYINGRRDKKEEEFLKSKPKKNKQGKITNGAIVHRLIQRLKHNTDKTAEISAIEKSKKTKLQTPLSFQQERHEALLCLLNDEVRDDEISTLKKDYHEFLLNNAGEYDHVTWLSKYAEKSKDISFATHVGKLTHSSSKGSSILDISDAKDNRYLSTNTLDNPEIDTASSNAASLPIADILKLSVDGVTVIDCLKNNDLLFLRELSDDVNLVALWHEQLKQAYDSDQKQSYFLSKQTYFPLTKNGYHLLLPLTSSSLVHHMFLTHKKRFNDEKTVTAFEQKKANKYSDLSISIVSNRAILHVTGSNHSNASSLNGKRGGRVALLPTMPPQWKSSRASYRSKDTLFDRTLSYALQEQVGALTNYLLLIKSKQLSISQPKRNAAVIAKLQSISDEFFDHIEAINCSENTEGWSIDCALPLNQQLLCEPWRNDDAAKALTINNQWQKTISQEYARWLNKQLNKDKRLNLTSIHTAIWRDAFSAQMREMTATMEINS